MRRAAKSRDNAWCAASVLATTIRPLVSLSSRCTMPGRRTPPMPDKLAPQWAEQGVDESAVGISRRGMDNHARRLVDDDQVCILEADIERDRLRDRRGILNLRENYDEILVVSHAQRRVAQNSSLVRDLAGLDQALQPRPRQFSGKCCASTRSSRCPASVSPARIVVAASSSQSSQHLGRAWPGHPRLQASRS